MSFSAPSAPSSPAVAAPPAPPNPPMFGENATKVKPAQKPSMAFDRSILGSLPTSTGQAIGSAFKTLLGQ